MGAKEEKSEAENHFHLKYNLSIYFVRLLHPLSINYIIPKSISVKVNKIRLMC